MNESQPKYLSIPQACVVLGIKKSAFYDWERKGLLNDKYGNSYVSRAPGRRPRIHWMHVKAVLDRQTESTGGEMRHQERQHEEKSLRRRSDLKPRGEK